MDEVGTILYEMIGNPSTRILLINEKNLLWTYVKENWDRIQHTVPAYKLGRFVAELVSHLSSSSDPALVQDVQEFFDASVGRGFNRVIYSSVRQGFKVTELNKRWSARYEGVLANWLSSKELMPRT
jgi:hypothetical protein